MSSDHTYMSVEEHNRMVDSVRNGESRIRSVEDEIQRIQSEIGYARVELSNAVARNRKLVDDAVANMRTTTTARFNDVKSGLDASIVSRVNDLDNQFNAISDEMGVVLSDINVINDNIANIAQTYSDIFSYIENQQADRIVRANMRKDELDSLDNRIKELRPEQFCPTEYAELVSLRESMRINIANGDAQAALANSSLAIINGSRLLATLIVLNERYNNLLNLAHNELLNAREYARTISANGTSIEVMLGDRKANLDYDIRRWSSGRFDALTAEIDEIENNINSNMLSVEALETEINNLQSVNERLHECDIDARCERVSTVFVQDNARRIANIMIENGWRIVSSGFVDEDRSRPYVITLDDGAGNQSGIVISAEGGSQTSYRLEVISEDKDVVRSRATKDGLLAALEGRGVNVDGVETRTDCAENTSVDIFVENAINEAVSHKMR